MRKEEAIRLEKTGNRRHLHYQRKYVQNIQQSQGVEDAMRQHCQVIDTEISESSKKWSRTNVQGWLNFMPRYSPPLELWFQPPVLESCMAKLKKSNCSSSFMRQEVLSNCISLGQGEERRNYQDGEDRKQKISLLSAKVRTIVSVKPGSRRCRAVVLSGHCQREFWKQQGAKSNEYSGLAQSHISLPTTTRALISTPRTRKWRDQIKRKKEKKKKAKTHP